MKKTNILAALFLLVAGMQQAWAQKVVLHKADGEVFEYSVSKLDSMVIVGRYDTDNKEWVDLGLPSGTLWATCNIGASSPEEYGDYFAWAETKPKDNYTWDTYIYFGGMSEDNIGGRMLKYCANSTDGYNGFTDTLTELLSEEDAATACWGREWQTPSLVQIRELYTSTTTEWTTQNGVKGTKITGNNGNSIFLPAAGYLNETDSFAAGREGCYWSRSLYTDQSYSAYNLYFHSRGMAWNGWGRDYGLSVRPVRKK